MVKTLSAAMMPRIRLKSMVGEIIGSVIFQNLAQRPAPSISAASTNSLGTPCKPARKISMALPPMPAQSAMMATDGNAHCFDVSQPGPSIPNHDKTKLIGPTLGLKIHVQSSARATVGVRWGRKKEVRKKFVPLAP